VALLAPATVWSPSGAPAGASSPESPGCSAARATGTTTLSLTVAGVKRVAVVFSPRTIAPGRPAALVVNLHGSGSTALDQVAFSGMDKEAKSAGFIVVYPQGVIPDARGFDWNVPHEPLMGGRNVPRGSPSDVAYLTDLVSAMEAKYCVDPREVYATGFSGGARMASQLACDASATFAAVAPVSGLRLPFPCPATRAVPVITFHGTADPVDPYDGHGQAYWTYSVPTAAKRWATHDGCQELSLVNGPASSVRVTRYTKCTSGAEVELYTITGEGHEWPGGPTMNPLLTAVLGPQSSAVNADATMWRFFRAHPLA
jgi:polyhydroxybutyrate depolymerase